MSKWFAIALGALAVVSAQPAQAQAVAVINGVKSQIDNSPSDPGAGVIEVGKISEYSNPTTIEDIHTLTGLVEAFAFYDFDPDPFGPTYLTFDLLAQGGSYAPPFGPGNVDRPFDGEIALGWFIPAFLGDPGLVVTPLTTFSVAAATTGAGSTFSLRIDALLDTVLAGVPAAGSDIGFKLTAIGAPNDTAWLFNNFRLTETDQTNLIGGAVPEPAGWAMMIVGFLAVGSSLRGARRLAAA
ncbi:PEPxxWA-CTERM sorting domain-containing protein [Phenylobacterium sp.]|uniref:PEPxxWA-CTERM sorting domain-containing protein n=1 Tax=Phenylobacterium sp. TaxID=1871053 RepID=UPI002ED9C004